MKSRVVFALGAALLALVTGGCISLNGATVPPPPAPYGPVPTARQLRWENMQFYGFLHFGVNTFTDREWGYGDENPNVFDPTDFNPDQIARVAKMAGMKGLVLTAKHHDGFCLWPSKYTKHSVKYSRWENGHGDVVRDMAAACRRHGLLFGVYLSPWDRNRADYGQPSYIQYYRNQLRELLTHYGKLFIVWFDGANGGTGYYGGARERRVIDRSTYYDWPDTRKIVRQLQPMACMFSDAGPDVRWVGNERGIAGDPCWETLNAAGRYPGGPSEGLNSGQRPGTNWMPPECDVSIRPGWFYHPEQNNQVKTPAQLVNIYFKSVGRGACLNLNIPPDRRGQIHDTDVRALRGFRHILDATFATNLAAHAKITASNTRGDSAAYGPQHLVDGRHDTYWATDDHVTQAQVIVEFSQPTEFNVISLREYIPLGQRIDAFAVDQWHDGKWQQIAHDTSIGHLRLLRLAPVRTERVRLRITKAAACPALSEFGLYREPAYAH